MSIEMISFRLAAIDDVFRIVELLADDPIGSTRESLEPCDFIHYEQAFAAIESSPHSYLWVAILEKKIVATAQLDIFHSLSRQGSKRAQLESIRVCRTHRRQGIGQALMDHLLKEAKNNGARLVQLTTDRKRPKARQFYENLGFRASHNGMKIILS